jgi:leader peptidase (prepilin peptidase) / N-methyltransferase
MLNDIADLYTASPALFTGSMFVLGLMVGSFLNVVIYRLPVMLDREWRAQAAEYSGSSATTIVAPEASAPPVRFNLIVPRSACPNCRAPITAWQNIPVISWLALKGRCAACKTPISTRYPAIELATGLLSAWAAWHFGFGAAAMCAVGVTWALIALTGIDIDHQLLPDNITLPLLWAGLLAAVVIGPVPGSALPVAPREAILGAIAGYLSLWLVFHVFRLITGKEGMGFGDFKLFGALGAWMGWKVLPLIIVLSAGTGAVLGISMIALKGRDRTAPIPFGPYLAAAGWVAMLYGTQLLGGYLRFSGLRR